MQNLTELCEAVAKEIQVRSSQLKCHTKVQIQHMTKHGTTRKSHMHLCKKYADLHFLLIWTQAQASY